MTLATVRPEKSMSDALHPERYTFGSVRIAARSAAVGEPLAAPAGAASASAAISEFLAQPTGGRTSALLLESTAPRDRAAALRLVLDTASRRGQHVVEAMSVPSADAPFAALASTLAALDVRVLVGLTRVERATLENIAAGRPVRPPAAARALLGAVKQISIDSDVLFVIHDLPRLDADLRGRSRLRGSSAGLRPRPAGRGLRAGGGGRVAGVDRCGSAAGGGRGLAPRRGAQRRRFAGRRCVQRRRFAGRRCVQRRRFAARPAPRIVDGPDVGLGTPGFGAHDRCREGTRRGGLEVLGPRSGRAVRR